MVQVRLIMNFVLSFSLGLVILLKKNKGQLGKILSRESLPSRTQTNNRHGLSSPVRALDVIARLNFPSIIVFVLGSFDGDDQIGDLSNGELRSLSTILDQVIYRGEDILSRTFKILSVNVILI